MLKYVANISFDGILTVFSIDDSFLKFEKNENDVEYCYVYNPIDKILIILGTIDNLFYSEAGLLVLKKETHTKYSLIQYLFKGDYEANRFI